MNTTLVAGLFTDPTYDGLIPMSEALTRQDNPCKTFNWYNALPAGSDIYIGHSFGCRAILNMLLKNMYSPVKLFVLIDPVDYFWRDNFFIPPNVAQAVCFRRSGAWLPPSRLILNPIPLKYVNTADIPSSHHDIPTNLKVVNTIFTLVSSLK